MSTTLQNTYFPVLKGKAGELQALNHAPATARQAMIPILDLPIDDDSDQSEIATAVAKFATNVCSSYDATNFVIVDASVTDGISISGHSALEDLHARLRADTAAVPVVTTGSSAGFLAAASAVAAIDGNGVCIRLGGPDFENTGALSSDIQSIVATLNLPPSKIDLVLDLGYVDGNSATAYAGFIPLLIGSLPDVHDWRSLVVASGAFPQSLSSLKPYTPQKLKRHDADLWGRIIRAQPVRIPQYGDYATSHPTPGTTVGYRSAPNIRYTTDGEWYVVKTDMDRAVGNRTIFKIADQLRGETPSVLERADFSWGDGELHRCADSTGGPGGGKEWKAWATSHHLATVITNLATTGAP